MLIQRYDIPAAGSPTGFVSRTWSPVNSPVLDVAGRAVGVLHHVEDITGLDRLAPDGALTVSLGNPALLSRDDVAATVVLRARLGQLAAAAASVSLRAGGLHGQLAATGRWAEELDALHLTVGQGPALTALATSLPVLVPDLAAAHDR